MIDSPKGYTPSQDDIRQILAQMMKETLSRLPADTRVDNAQLLMQLPLDITRQYLRSIIAQQLEIACGICVKHATEVDNAYALRVKEFEKTIKAKIEKCYGALK